MAAGRPGHRPVRVRVRHLRVLPGRRRAGLSTPDPAGVHRARLVRRAGRDPRGRRQPRRAARVRRLRHRRLARLPVRHRVPGAHRARQAHARRLARRPRLRRRRPVRGDDRRARELGAHVVDDPAAIAELTGGGAHVSVDAVGSPVTAVNSVRSLRRRGRHVQAGLLLGTAATPPLPMDLA
ncbi:zinc-binding dehydrogenase [Actinophytocola sp.]|uniref:zinc-binding dehydrogenase n=1 Tax=Actinophytocola sp. TaxID=1872138 RepID=UPI0025BAA9B9|nr:zinc-binding dehydrogenase [Actinophytocola sp.]